MLVQAIAQVSAPHCRHLLIRGDSAAATHAVLDWLTAQNGKRDRRVEHSIGWSIECSGTDRDRRPARLGLDWAIDADGGVRDGAQWPS